MRPSPLAPFSESPVAGGAHSSVKALPCTPQHAVSFADKVRHGSPSGSDASTPSPPPVVRRPLERATPGMRARAHERHLPGKENDDAERRSGAAPV